MRASNPSHCSASRRLAVDLSHTPGRAICMTSCRLPVPLAVIWACAAWVIHAGKSGAAPSGSGLATAGVSSIRLMPPLEWDGPLFGVAAYLNGCTPVPTQMSISFRSSRAIMPRRPAASGVLNRSAPSFLAVCGAITSEWMKRSKASNRCTTPAGCRLSSPIAR